VDQSLENAMMEAFLGFLSDVHLAQHKECPQYPLHLARRRASEFIGNHAGLACYSSMSATEKQRHMRVGFRQRGDTSSDGKTNWSRLLKKPDVPILRLQKLS
jgi:hypothetical protein